MAAPLKTGIPPGLDLADGYLVQFTALDPTTGAVNATVKVSGASLLVTQLSEGEPEALTVGEPLWLPVPSGFLGDQA